MIIQCISLSILSLFIDQLILMTSVSPGALIVYAAILNQKLASSLQKKSHKRKKRPKLLDEVELQYVHRIKVRLVGYQ